MVRITFAGRGVKAVLTGHLPHHWLLNNRLYSLPGRKQRAHQGSGLPLCSDFMAFYATIRNTVYSMGAHCARLQRGFVTGWGAKQGVLDTVTRATAWPAWRQLWPLGPSHQKARGRAGEGCNFF